MQIIIPMSGFGERFRRAGYEVPKPLIEIYGKPMIAYVIDMFPGEKNFIFICNEKHLRDPSYRMAALLEQYCPSGRVVGIPEHALGPVNAVCQVEQMLEPEEPVIVNYCDFTCYWDWAHFKYWIRATGCQGAIPAYKGFHPHSLGTTNYAYIRENEGSVTDIQEKRPFTDDRIEEFASSGTYYFASAQIMSESFRAMMNQDLDVGGEYYVSLAYKYLLARNQSVLVYPLQHFMQWGTPEDLVEFKYWSNVFLKLIRKREFSALSTGSSIIPMAGIGQRFVAEGYPLAKPLIPVSGLPMVAQAASDLPPSENQVFVLRTDMLKYSDLISKLTEAFPKAIFEPVSQVTEGQACTALIGLNALIKERGNDCTPITIGACDNGVIYDVDFFNKLIKDDSIDVIVWGIRGYINAIKHPEMFGWINAEDGHIRSISVKAPLDKPDTDPIVLGTFTFRRAEDFLKAFELLTARNGRIKGEFYIDSMINDAITLGLKCRLFEVDSYLCWGTPNDLRTYEYWQSCFHKWQHHPYTLNRDKRIPRNQLDSLEKKYRAQTPTIPRAQR